MDNLIVLLEEVDGSGTVKSQRPVRSNAYEGCHRRDADLGGSGGGSV